MAQIDIEGMTRMVKSMQDIGEALEGIRHEYARSLRRFGASDREARDLEGPQRWVQERLPDLRRRLALAQQIEAASPGWSSGVVTIEESMVCTLGAEEARRAGSQTARALLDGPGVLDAALLARLDELSSDPYFAAGFAAALSPRDLARVVTRLSNVRPVFDGRNGQTYEEYQASTAWYEAALASMSRTLATATYNTGDLALPDDYARTWVAAITAAPVSGPGAQADGTAVPSQAAALGLLLGSGGRFENRFLGEVADGVYTYERAYTEDDGGALWRGRTTTGQPGRGIVDPAGGWYVDPMVGVMSALGRNPVAAQDFLTRGATSTIDVDGVDVTVGERLQYLLVDRTWAAHRAPGDALGAALQAATTTFRDRDARGEVSAQLAGQAFALIGEQTGQGLEAWRGDQGWQMHDGLRVHVAQMLASYGADVFRVSTDDNGDDLSRGVHGLGSGVLFPEDQMPYGVRMSKEHLATIVGVLGETPEDFEPLLVGLFQANNLAIETGLQRASAEYGTVEAAARFWVGQHDLYSPAFTDAGRAAAWVLETGRGGAEADEAAKKTQAELVADALSTVLDMPFVPEIKGDWLKQGYGETKGWALDQVKDVATDAKGRYSDADGAAREDLERSVMNVLLRAGYLSPEAQGHGAFAGGPPPPDAINEGPDGRPVGFDFESPLYDDWYRQSPVRSIVAERVINTYASTYRSVP